MANRVDATDEIGIGKGRVARDEERRLDPVPLEEVQDPLDPDHIEFAARDHARVIALERADPKRRRVKSDCEAACKALNLHISSFCKLDL